MQKSQSNEWFLEFSCFLLFRRAYSYEKGMAQVSEYKHLCDFYGDNQTMGFTTFNTLSTDDKKCVKRMLQNIIPFESPDMYSKFDNNIFIIEHFEFDASKHNRKGMSGIREENLLRQRIRENATDNYMIDQTRYSVDKKSFQKNFEDTFSHHYKKIDKYIENLKSQGIVSDGDKIHIGFFVENVYPPLYEELRNGKLHFVGELLYFLTKQFYDFLQNKVRLDFVLFGCIYQQAHRLFYIKPLDRGGDLIDLEEDSIVFSKINGNEIVWAAHF